MPYGEYKYIDKLPVDYLGEKIYDSYNFSAKRPPTRLVSTADYQSLLTYHALMPGGASLKCSMRLTIGTLIPKPINAT